MKQIKILYVDDEEVNLQLFEINLRGSCQVFSAPDALSGMKILAENPDISIVFSDMKMPEINGIEFIEMARKKYQEMHFFIVTGYDINEEIESALRNGVIHKYFRKPFQIADIKAAIAKVTQ